MSRLQSIFVNHNAEIAHRLSNLPGKCQNIHGHSLKIEMTLIGAVDQRGLLNGFDFGFVKRHFRGWIDDNWDHRLLLNSADPWTEVWECACGSTKERLPGLWVHSEPGDPTIENLCRWLGEAMTEFFNYLDKHGEYIPVLIRIQETETNGASWMSEG